MNWLKRTLLVYKMQCLANERGWGSLGRMFSYGDKWTPRKFRCELRRSNRLHRVALGLKPWP